MRSNLHEKEMDKQRVVNQLQDKIKVCFVTVWDLYKLCIFYYIQWLLNLFLFTAFTKQIRGKRKRGKQWEVILLFSWNDGIFKGEPSSPSLNEIAKVKSREIVASVPFFK